MATFKITFNLVDVPTVSLSCSVPGLLVNYKPALISIIAINGADASSVGQEDISMPLTQSYRLSFTSVHILKKSNPLSVVYNTIRIHTGLKLRIARFIVLEILKQRNESEKYGKSYIYKKDVHIFQ